MLARLLFALGKWLVGLSGIAPDVLGAICAERTEAAYNSGIAEGERRRSIAVQARPLVPQPVAKEVRLHDCRTLEHTQLSRMSGRELPVDTT